MCLPYLKFSDLLPQTHLFFYLALEMVQISLHKQFSVEVQSYFYLILKIAAKYLYLHWAFATNSASSVLWVLFQNRTQPLPPQDTKLAELLFLDSKNSI